ncbi:MAG TPA: ABC transporter permease subunit [Chloroflexaceae bacterium]|nr:ABC transporter permease subunit [Chloroflexaceae bacterium]
MASVTHAVAPTGQQLQSISGHGRLRGMGNMLANELRRWWGTRRWVVHLLLWIVLLNGLILLIGLTAGSDPSETEPTLDQLIDAFLQVSAVASGIGIVTVAQGVIVGEKQRGTAAWLLAKPASRSAFVLARLVAYAASFGGLALLLPATLFYGEAIFLTGQAPSPVGLLTGVGVLAVHLLFYLALTLMLGAFFNGRGPVAGVGVGMVVAGFIAPMLLPQSVLLATPWPLRSLAPGLALGGELPAGWPIPLAASALWATIFVGAALWRFGREEF